MGCTRKPRSPLNDQWCSDVSQLICGVWWCRLRVRCSPIRSVRWGSLSGSRPASFRVRRVPAHLRSLAVSTACLVRSDPQRPPRVRWGSLLGSRPTSFRLRRVPAHLQSLAVSTARLVRPDPQHPPRVRWGSLLGSRPASFRVLG